MDELWGVLHSATFLAALLSGALGGGIVSFATAKVIADKAESGRRRASERRELVGKVAVLRAEVRSATGRIQQGQGLSSAAFGHDRLVVFAVDSAVLGAHLALLQRRHLRKEVCRLVGAFIQLEGDDLADAPAQLRWDLTMGWATATITSAAAGGRRGRRLLGGVGLLEQAATKQDLALFEEADRRLGRLPGRPRRSW